MKFLLKGFLKNSSLIVQLLFVISIVLFGIALSGALFQVVVLAKEGFDMERLANITANIDSYPGLLRQMLLFQTIFGFFLPAIILASLFSDDIKDYLHTENGVSGSVIGLTILSVVFILPIINAIVYWTKEIPLPEFMASIEATIIALEEQSARLLESVLITDNYGLFLLNFAIIGILTAVGEEFIFRGVLQNIFGKAIRNHHVVIWLVAFIFSFVHFQFYGFFARAILGAYLGYLLYYSKSIWIPVIAHLTNNAIGIINYYTFKDPEMMKEMDNFGTNDTLWASIISLLLFSATAWLIIRLCKKNT